MLHSPKFLGSGLTAEPWRRGLRSLLGSLSGLEDEEIVRLPGDPKPRGQSVGGRTQGFQARGSAHWRVRPVAAQVVVGTLAELIGVAWTRMRSAEFVRQGPAGGRADQPEKD